MDLEPAEGVVLAAKRHLVDPALAAAMLRLDLGAVLSDSDVLGRLLDTFVVAQLRSELAVCETRPRLYYLREEHGRHEIDIVAELGEGNLLAFRGRGRAPPDRDAARHLAWVREQLGERFGRGVVFHTGPGSYELDDGIAALPICVLWGRLADARA